MSALAQLIKDYEDAPDVTDTEAQALFADARTELAALSTTRAEIEALRKENEKLAWMLTGGGSAAWLNENTDLRKRVGELEAENRMLRSRPSYSRHSYVDGIPSDEE